VRRSTRVDEGVADQPVQGAGVTGGASGGGGGVQGPPAGGCLFDGEVGVEVGHVGAGRDEPYMAVGALLGGAACGGVGVDLDDATLGEGADLARHDVDGLLGDDGIGEPLQLRVVDGAGLDGGRPGCRQRQLTGLHCPQHGGMAIDEAVGVGHEALGGEHGYIHRQRDLGHHASVGTGRAAHAEIGVDRLAFANERGHVADLQGLQPPELCAPILDPLQPSQRRLHPAGHPTGPTVLGRSTRPRTAPHTPDTNPHHRQNRRGHVPCVRTACGRAPGPAMTSSQGDGVQPGQQADLVGEHRDLGDPASREGQDVHALDGDGLPGGGYDPDRRVQRTGVPAV
jgi:hypothetical protein